MKYLQIKDEIRGGRNLMFYNKDVYNCFKKLKNDFLCVYYNEPLPLKTRLIDLINYISHYSKAQLKRLAIPDLTELLLDEIRGKTLIILFNNFDRLTERSLITYQQLNQAGNIQFICSFSVVKKFPPEVYSFFRTFKLINIDEYMVKHTRDEINITYAVYGILSIYCFFIYMKTSYSCNMASILIGGAWFAFLIFRTLMYAGGRT